MKRYLTVLFAGAMLASAAFPANGDPFQAERFKAKTGRYPVKSTVAAQECTSGCCRRPQMAKMQKAPAPSDSQFFFEAWSQAKWGRSLRRSDWRPQAGGSNPTGILTCRPVLPVELLRLESLFPEP